MWTLKNQIDKNRRPFLRILKYIFLDINIHIIGLNHKLHEAELKISNEE